MICSSVTDVTDVTDVIEVGTWIWGKSLSTAPE